MHISVSHLAYCYADSSLSALVDLTASFAEGWTGIVGSNGAGKSTLLSLVCGSLEPDSGSITPSVTGVYCPQATDREPTNLFDFASDYSGRAVHLRSLLEVEDEWIWRYDTLSHGEKKRVQIACALSLEPAVLALDEPTNHLDTQTRYVLLRALQQYRGVGLLVSHDRQFLDELVYQCLFLEEGSGKTIPGAYTQGSRQRDLDRRTVQAERKVAQNELSRVHLEEARRKVEAGRTAARRSARHLDKHDSDGRAKRGLAIVSGQDGKAGLLSAQMDKKVEVAQKRLDGARVKKVYDKPLEIDTEPAKRKFVAHLTAASIPMGDTRVLTHPDLFVGPRDRIGLRGRNGAGKSTLLSALMSQSKGASATEILLIPQEIDPAEGKAILAEVKRLPAQEKGKVLSIVARLNSAPERVLSGEDLSPGELRKIMLARGLLKTPYLVVMDEPTNHLDIHSIEALQEVLSHCRCALLLVSHDDIFLDALTDMTWEFRVEGDATGSRTTVIQTSNENLSTE